MQEEPLHPGPALGLIDVQRGFMPLEEGSRLHAIGFGELPVADGEKIVPNLNRLVGAFAMADFNLFTTQDWHPENTAHFSEEPNYTTTWPVHCVAKSSGADLHPALVLPQRWVKEFHKGMEELQRGEDDTSYSGFNAVDEYGDTTMEQYIRDYGVTEVVLGGLALDYCVKATALDMRKYGLPVTVVSDATKPVAELTGLAALSELEVAGVHIATTQELLDKLAATSERDYQYGKVFA